MNKNVSFSTIWANKYTIDTTAINANTTAQIQSVKDLFYKEKAEAQAAKINKLELQQALCGVPRVSPYGYGIYAYPPFTGACPTAGNI